MPEISISIKNKMAYPASNKIAYPASGKAFIVRDNSDYVVNFEFDSEWDVYADMAKTARFAFGGGYVDVPFTGNSVNVPIISKGREVNIGVFAGNLSTTTPASFPLLPSIRSKGGAPIEPESSVYDKIMALIKSGGVDPEVIANAVETYLAEHPIAETDPTVPAWAKAATKPTYTASEVGALSDTTVIPSVDGMLKYTAQSLTDAQKQQARANIGAGTSSFDGNYNSLSNKPTIPAQVAIDSTLKQSGKAADAKAVGDALTEVDTKLDEKQPKGNYLTTESDPSVPAWAKSPTKPTYTASEVGAISQDDLQSATNAALAQAKASGEFKGDKGDPGSDASVTQASIAAALGYTAADAGKLLGVGDDGTAGPVDRELFICTITASGDGYTCDRTTGDIMNAKAAGKAIYAYDGTIFYPATAVNGAAVRFEVLNGVNDIGYMLISTGQMSKINVQLQQTSNRVTALSASSTDAQYPSAKCVWDAIQAAGKAEYSATELEADTAVISYMLGGAEAFTLALEVPIVAEARTFAIPIINDVPMGALVTNYGDTSSKRCSIYCLRKVADDRWYFSYKKGNDIIASTGNLTGSIEILNNIICANVTGFALKGYGSQVFPAGTKIYTVKGATLL